MVLLDVVIAQVIVRRVVNLLSRVRLPDFSFFFIG